MAGPNPFSDGVSVQVGGDASGATRALGRVQSSLLTTRKMALGLGGVLAGALAAKGLGAAISAAADFETAMVELQKVTDPETADEMAGSIRELSKVMPVAQEELAAIAADAARFGVRGPENIEKFTTTVAKMATATDLSTEQAGEAFARLATLTNTPVDEMENLGSAINELSNNMATSSGEIVDSMLRGSAALTSFGLNNTEIVGMSAALNEVSESSERAGSRLRRLGQELMDPRKVADIANALDMTEKEFRDIRRERPRHLMMRIVEAMAEGDETAEALRGTLSTTSRQAIGGLAQNLDGLREALELSTKSFEEGKSVQEEYDAATDTFNSRLQTFKNRLNDAAIELGNKLLPVASDLLDEFMKDGGLVDAVGEFLQDILTEENIQKVVDFGKDLGKLITPSADVARELGELAGNLAELLLTAAGEETDADSSDIEKVAGAIQVLADALARLNDELDTFNERFEGLPSLQDVPGMGSFGAQTPGPGGEFPIEGQARDFWRNLGLLPRPNPQVGSGGGGRAGGVGGIEIVIEGDTAVVKDVAVNAAQGVQSTTERRADRFGSRGVGISR